MKLKDLSIPAVFALSASCIIGFTACSPDAESSSQREPGSILIEPGVRVGDVRNGMTVDEVVAVLGKPDGESGRFLEYRRLAYSVGYDRDGVVRTVMCGGSTGLSDPLAQAFKGRTQEGLGIGSTRADIVEAYGEPSSAVAAGGLGTDVLKYGSIGMTFTLNEDRVFNIVVDFRVGQ